MSERNELFRRSPWRKGSPELLTVPVGMLGRQEAALFYYLARDWYSGRGTIVDAGSFLGKSAFHFGHGLRANPRFDPARHKVHCFDNFLVNDGLTIDFIETELGQRLGLHQSTRPIFDWQVASVQDVLVVHEGDFHVMPWQSQPVEILMVDIAKSPSLWRRVLEAFFRDLVPGVSIVVHQDYHHPWLPHIHVTMEWLAPYFEPCVTRADDTAAWLYVREIPADVLARAVKDDFTVAERLQLMDRAVERLPKEDRHHVELARIVLRLQSVDATVVRKELDALPDLFPAVKEDRNWIRYAADIGNHVDEFAGWAHKARGEHDAALAIADRLIARGRRSGHMLHMRASSLRALGRPEAEAALREAIEVRPHSGYACIELADLLSRRGQFDEADALLFKAVGDPDAIPTPLEHYCDGFGMVWMRRGRFEDAMAGLARLQRDFPSHPEVWVLAAKVQRHMGRATDCAANLRRARECGLAAARLDELCRTLHISPLAMQA